MAAINWFPGHMHKARLEIATQMRRVKLVIEVLDARAPFSSENPLVPQLRGSTPYLKVLNKSDLADPEVTKRWIDHLSAESGVEAIAARATNSEEARKVLARGEELLGSNSDKASLVMILGIPNAGKSTLINAMAGKQICRTENRPAVTQRQQRIVLSKRVTLLDTPGFLWPRLSPNDCAYRLAICGSIKDGIFSYDVAAQYLAKYFARMKPEAFGAYDIKSEDLPKIPEEYGDDETKVNEVLSTEWYRNTMSKIAEKRNLLSKGGVPDIDRAAEIFVRDFRKGSLGRITLETPEMVATDEYQLGKIDGARTGADRRGERRDERRRLRKAALKQNKKDAAGKIRL
mmetsp:Transcript_6973/g.13939  ORF Transcript_6973/g.13939 Transcript_6973/m.13939 type:complete len:345 (-) Transcript_6973:236-1270(-)|eukprot:CAMPEP_0171515788 /NCGR_PEP_ID=MMETSP0959-20130129/3662_1 /TAXON_ID=87120 /ORGANISM="Aurantiochytrium limacinum, Strain ATCCMYA-1381" /LENGTH=344 /DNA_ID=CAMNT_0012054399 /DNA_START=123 /DNA_END=1157 /DNA_ORIENTATION=+